jgi:nucleoside 2-deoxyribosyltransferase
MLIYISGPYSADTREGIQANIDRAKAVAEVLLRMGHAVICPHMNTAHLGETVNLSHDQWITMDMEMLCRCDAVTVLPNWKASKGTVAEVDYAEELGIPLYFLSDNWMSDVDLCLPQLSPTEVRCPQQAKAFREILGRMYRTHLKKNADYSPANILGTAEIGLVTRIWDKVSRLMSLLGFRVEIVSSVYTAPKAPNNESIEDTYLDNAVYSVIGLLYRMGVWGK